MNLSEIFLTDGTISPTLMLWMFYIAAVLGAIVYFNVNSRLGKIVTRLLELEACSPETAVSIVDAEIKPSFFTKMCLRAPMNYKNLLVALTSDGKYYANLTYTDEPPLFRQLHAITRKRKSRIKESKTVDAVESNEKIELEPQETLPIDEAIPETSKAVKPEKVNFNPFTAKYYIPKEVHDRAKGLFKSSKANVFVLIAALIGLGVVIFFASFLLDGMIDAISNL